MKQPLTQQVHTARWDDRLQSRVADHLASRVPEPPVLFLSRATGSGPAGYSLASCPGLVSVKEEGRSGGGEGVWGVFLYSPVKIWLCLPVSMTTALLQYSAVGWPLHLKAVPSGVSGPLFFFLSAALSSSSSSSSSLAVSLFIKAAALHLHSLLYFQISTSNIISIWIRADVCFCSLFKFPKTTSLDL